MKIKEGYILREVAGNNIVVAVGNVDFNGMISLNDTGTLLWKELETGCDQKRLVNVLLEHYDIDEATASKDVETFIAKLVESDLVQD